MLPVGILHIMRGRYAVQSGTLQGGGVIIMTHGAVGPTLSRGIHENN